MNAFMDTHSARSFIWVLLFFLVCVTVIFATIYGTRTSGTPIVDPTKALPHKEVVIKIEPQVVEEFIPLEVELPEPIETKPLRPQRKYKYHTYETLEHIHTHKKPLQEFYINAQVEDVKLNNVENYEKQRDEDFICIYMNLAHCTERRETIEKELSALKRPVYRLEAIYTPGNGGFGCNVSHLYAVAWAAIQNTHTLICEDDFMLDVSVEELETYIQEARDITHDRWDVLQIGQYVQEWAPFHATEAKILRLYSHTTSSGFLVHKDYAPRLFSKWYEAFQEQGGFAPKIIPMKGEDFFDQIQNEFTHEDIWIGFDKALGSQCPGTSIIGEVHAINKWSCSEDRTQWYDAYFQAFPLLTLPPIQLFTVALCFVATGPYVQFLHRVITSCQQNFLKPHQLDIFIFTEQNISDITRNVCACQIHTYKINRRGFPYDSLYRYRYMLLAEAELKHFDYIFYMDVDYYVCQPTETELILSTQNVIGTLHPYSLLSSRENRKGTPETRPNSTAFITDARPMSHYFCGGFQGGISSIYLKACRNLDANITQDEKNGILAVWHDESHWNRYLFDNPPSVILSQSYIYPEEFLYEGNTHNMEMAERYRKAEIVPRMVALQKKHKDFQTLP